MDLSISNPLFAQLAPSYHCPGRCGWHMRMQLNPRPLGWLCWLGLVCLLTRRTATPVGFLRGHCQFFQKTFLWKHLDDSPTSTTSQTTPRWIFWVVAAQLFLDASVLATRNSKNHLLWNAGSGRRFGTVTTEGHLGIFSIQDISLEMFFCTIPI